jgi:hypothetical protein
LDEHRESAPHPAVGHPLPTAVRLQWGEGLLSLALATVRLGRAALSEDSPGALLPPDLQKTVADIVLCLKQIRKSVTFWNNQAGRQGYLDYVSSFF